MGAIQYPPVFIPFQGPIYFDAGDIGKVLGVISASELGWVTGGGGGGGLTGRYTATLTGATSELAPSGFPGTDTGSRIIITCTADSLVQTMTAGNDGQLVLLWNNTSVGDGFNLELAGSGTGAGAPFLINSGPGFIPAQSGLMVCYDVTLAAWLIT